MLYKTIFLLVVMRLISNIIKNAYYTKGYFTHGRGRENRTPNSGFGDHYYTI